MEQWFCRHYQRYREGEMKVKSSLTGWGNILFGEKLMVRRNLLFLVHVSFLCFHVSVLQLETVISLKTNMTVSVSCLGVKHFACGFSVTPNLAHLFGQKRWIWARTACRPLKIATECSRMVTLAWTPRSCMSLMPTTGSQWWRWWERRRSTNDRGNWNIGHQQRNPNWVLVSLSRLLMFVVMIMERSSCNRHCSIYWHRVCSI